jgi:hypothetical protein
LDTTAPTVKLKTHAHHFHSTLECCLDTDDLHLTFIGLAEVVNSLRNQYSPDYIGIEEAKNPAIYNRRSSSLIVPAVKSQKELELELMQINFSVPVLVQSTFSVRCESAPMIF